MIDWDDEWEDIRPGREVDVMEREAFELRSRLFLSNVSPVDHVQSLRDGIISDMISSVEGRRRLAESMIAPLRVRVDYSGFARQTLSVEPLDPAIVAVLAAR